MVQTIEDTVMPELEASEFDLIFMHGDGPARQPFLTCQPPSLPI
jgi:hypothetical protein